jgi:hypothetical protein
MSNNLQNGNGSKDDQQNGSAKTGGAQNRREKFACPQVGSCQTGR